MTERESLLSVLARDAAERIQHDLSGRGGFDAWWESIDPPIQDDILDAMTELIAATFKGPLV